MKIYKHISLIFLSIFILIITGCATVPKEVVELSYTVGQDLEAVHLSYRSLLQKHFESLRIQTLTYLENRWIPIYLNEFIKSGDLIALAKDPDPVKTFEGVSAWVEVAIEEIENKKKQLLNPIEQDEKALLESVDEAFDRLIWANATITAHLNSIRKVKEVQDEALAALKLKDLRDQINHQLVQASQKAENAIKEMESAEAVIKKAGEQKQKLMEKLKGD